MSNKLYHFINLHNGEEDKEKVLANIKGNISFRGSNLWILACAIVIASVGLNVNSTAVIIGAMLISPLMGPIVGAGFALAIYDFELLKKSAKNLLIATLVSLVVAGIYFYISPFKETQSELLARTSPNIYDVLIAFFGGLVGVIALTRVEKGNPIPGVAIATALMPPLCTAGYGLAVGNYAYFLGAFYLYTINCFFICIATFFIVKYLKYQPVHYENTRHEKKIRTAILTLIFVMIIPSIYMAYHLFEEKKYNQNAERYIKQEFIDNGFTVIHKNIHFNAAPKKIELAFLRKTVSKEDLLTLNKRLNQYDLAYTQLIIKQPTKNEILNNSVLTEKDIVINNLQNELSTYKNEYPNIVKEINILFPELKNVSLGKLNRYINSDSAVVTTTLLYETNLEKTREIDEKLVQWLRQKLNTEEIKVVKIK